MKDEKPSIAKLWIARRIAEFPTLYPHSDQVIFSSVIGTQGDTYWDDNGLLQQADMCYKGTVNGKPKWGQYPLQMPMKTALTLAHNHGKSFHPYYNMSGPINKIPVNVEESWLSEISSFLYKWEKFDMDAFRMMATVECMLYYGGLRENPNAGLPNRTISNYEQFHKNIPRWKAIVASVCYQKEYNKVDPKTFQGEGI